MNEVLYFKDCLDEFYNCFDQSFHVKKSNIFFNCSANRQTASLVTAMMGFTGIKPDNAYLGLPLFRTGIVKEFSFLVERFQSKLAS